MIRLLPLLLVLTACSAASGQSGVENQESFLAALNEADGYDDGAPAAPLNDLVATADEPRPRLSLVEMAQPMLNRYAFCVRDNAAAWARSTNEATEHVLEAAIASCASAERAAKASFVYVMQAEAGFGAGEAEAAWNDNASDRRNAVRGVALTAIMNARSKR